jgi:hypothetical protein
MTFVVTSTTEGGLAGMNRRVVKLIALITVAVFILTSIVILGYSVFPKW